VRIKFNQNLNPIEVERLILYGISRGWLIRDKGVALSELEEVQNVEYVIGMLVHDYTSREIIIASKESLVA
jgi:hypothetical protein